MAASAIDIRVDDVPAAVERAVASGAELVLGALDDRLGC
jgi:hypothetical protein